MLKEGVVSEKSSLGQARVSVASTCINPSVAKSKMLKAVLQVSRHLVQDILSKNTQLSLIDLHSSEPGFTHF